MDIERNDKNFFLLNSMPRSGSTLLSSILNQNSLIHSEGFSPVCRVLWDTSLQFSKEIYIDEFLSANRNSNDLGKKTMQDFIGNYYVNLKDKVILDKSASWCLPANQNIAKSIFGENVKTIITTRPVFDIVKSYLHLFIENDIKINYENVFSKTPLLRSVASTMLSFLYPSNNFFYIDYDYLIKNPEDVIDRVYTFLNIPKFNHDLNNIVCLYPENEDSMGIKNINLIRGSIEKRNIDVSIPRDIFEHVNKINYFINLSKINNISSSDKNECLYFIKDIIF